MELQVVGIVCCTVNQFYKYIGMHASHIMSGKKEGNFDISSLLQDGESGLAPELPSHKGFAMPVL